MFSIILLVIIISLIVISIIKVEFGLLAFLFVAPFYTILRETSNGNIIFYLWPYLLISCIMMVIIIKYCIKTINWNNNKNIILGVSVLSCLVGLFFWLLVDTGLLEIIMQSNKSIFLKKLSLKNILFFLLPILFILSYFFYVYFKVMKHREGKTSFVDIIITIFFWYGIFEILYSYMIFGSILNAMDGFRYYFIMSIIYFICRYLIIPEKHLNIIKYGFALVFLFAALFIVFESYCMNCLKIEPKDLPWAGLLLTDLGHTPVIEGEKAFMSGGYTPMGLIRMTHLSGLFLLFGFLLYLPIALRQSFYNNKIKTIGIWLFVMLLPIGIVFTSRTVLIIYVIGIPSVLILMRRSFIKSISVLCLFLFVLPLLYSYYLLPCLKYDIKREVGYVLTKKSHGSNAILNMINMMHKDIKYFSSHKAIKKTHKAIKKTNIVTEQVNTPANIFKNKYIKRLFGTGYSSTDWINKCGNKNKRIFKLMDTADSYYLKVMLQFGFVGLLILVLMGLFIMYNSIFVFYYTKDNTKKALYIGICVFLGAVFISLIHLGPLFKTGINTVIYMFFAIVVSIKLSMSQRSQKCYDQC